VCGATPPNPETAHGMGLKQRDDIFYFYFILKLKKKKKNFYI